MNQYEAGIVRAVLESAGFEETAAEREADVLLMLTCAVRSHAERRAIGRLGTFRAIRDAEPGRVVAVLGCMSRNVRDSLVSEHRADLVLGPDHYRHLPELIEQVVTTGQPVVRLDHTDECYEHVTPHAPAGVRGQVTIMRGCNNHCAYCIVPHTRGPERSRPQRQVLDEVRGLVETGVRDVTLLGQNALAYDDNGTDFVALLHAVAAIPGVERLRFLTSHPRDLDQRVVEAMAEIPAVCPDLHLPVQSGSDRILKMMGRRYTRGQYLDKVAFARRLLPDLGLTTDVLVGFPSETEADFSDTLDLIREVSFDFAYMFRYSQRPGTPAEGMTPKVSEADAGHRLARLIDVQNRITRERNARLVGREVELLIEAPGPRGRGMLGRTRTNKTVIVTGPAAVGDTLTCRITHIRGWTPIAETQAVPATPH